MFVHKNKENAAERTETPKNDLLERFKREVFDDVVKEMEESSTFDPVCDGERNSEIYSFSYCDKSWEIVGEVEVSAYFKCYTGDGYWTPMEKVLQDWEVRIIDLTIEYLNDMGELETLDEAEVITELEEELKYALR